MRNWPDTRAPGDTGDARERTDDTGRVSILTPRRESDCLSVEEAMAMTFQDGAEVDAIDWRMAKGL